MIDDMAVYFGDDFAVDCVRVRVGELDAAFAGILSVVDESMLQGHVTSAEFTLLFPSEAVELGEGDLVQSGGATFKVLRDPERVVDGSELRALLAVVNVP